MDRAGQLERVQRRVRDLPRTLRFLAGAIRADLGQ